MSNEQRYYDVLSRIACKYLSAAKLLKHGEKLYGVEGNEAVAMAYENIQADAESAIHGKRRPK